MIAQLPLLTHHAEVVVVTCAEHTLRHNLILALSTSDHPNDSSTGLKPELPNSVALHQSYSLTGPFLKVPVEDTLQFIVDFSSLAYLVADLP